MENAVETQHGCPVQDSLGQRVLHASRDQYVSVIKALADEGLSEELAAWPKY